MKTPDKAFDFWKDNRRDGHYQLTDVELTEKFHQWLRSKEQSWINYYSAERAIRFFITDKEGLSSVFEEKQFDDMYRTLKPIYLSYH